MRTRVKICGITRPEDALQAAKLGADAIGLVFYGPSPRAVSVEQARAIAGVMPPFVTVVGLFVDAQPAEISAVLDAVRLDALQFHGHEPAAECARYSRPYIKALRMSEDMDVHAAVREYAEASALLLDTYHQELPGGTGQTFDWSRVPMDLDKPIILSGGLNSENVAEAVRRVWPYAVDVSGGVEAAKGIKDHRKMAKFINEVNRVSIS
ncbi:MAG: phosphoribosylanthranilate isomerase [Gammaproteobacteria bacterium]